VAQDDSGQQDDRVTSVDACGAVSREFRFDGKVIVVTGAGTGIGAAHARLLARRGASVVANDVDASSGREVVEGILRSGGTVALSTASVATEEGATSIVDQAINTFGRLDGVVNNAGVLGSSPLPDLTLAEWSTIIGVCLTGPMLVTRAAWPHLVRSGAGRVVMTTSNSGLLGIPGSSAYAAAKAGLWGLVRVLAIEGEQSGIAVNGLAPMAYTAMSARSLAAPAAWRDGTGDEWSRRLDVNQVAPVAAWLCHESCPLSGEVLSAAGGRVARFFMGLTHGYASEALTIEEVAGSLETILDRGGFEVYRRAREEGRDLHRRLISPAAPLRPESG
jgi:NAD(P)-dependent dehydrogenase (short-subunit alcohol dehydrogenase family)